MIEMQKYKKNEKNKEKKRNLDSVEDEMDRNRSKPELSGLSAGDRRDEFLSRQSGMSLFRYFVATKNRS